MQILKHWRWATPIILAVAGLSYCNSGSFEYHHIRSLHWSQWEPYAQSLPIERRLDLNLELASRFGHNPPTIALTFGDRPLETYRAILKRLNKGDRRRAYSSILFAINGERGFRICAQPDRRIVQSYLHEVDGYPDNYPFDPPDFFTC